MGSTVCAPRVDGKSFDRGGLDDPATQVTTQAVSCDNTCCNALGRPLSVVGSEQPGVESRPATSSANDLDADGFTCAGLEEDVDVNETYFTREVKELLSLPLQDGDGPRRRPKYTFRTGATYEGEWKGNLRHGCGKQIWKDGAQFVGWWRENAASGHGKFVHPDGNYFIGQWRCNAAQGLGTMYNIQGFPTYRGQWVDDLQHGYGVERWEGGAYCGQFVWGKKQGRGVYEWPDSSTYSGDWQSNSIQGYGHYLANDGRQFFGMWKEAVIHGRGQYLWPDGRSFTGQYVRDRKEGFGVFAWPGGKSFEGWWLDGKQHGPGILRQDANCIVKQGIWRHGRPPSNPEEAPEVPSDAGASPR